MPHNRFLNGRHHAIEVLQDIVIPKPQDCVALRFQPSRPDLVFSNAGRFVVLSTVNLDDEIEAMAAEVGDVRTDRRLLAKMSAVWPERAEC